MVLIVKWHGCTLGMSVLSLAQWTVSCTGTSSQGDGGRVEGEEQGKTGKCVCGLLNLYAVCQMSGMCVATTAYA